MIAPKAILFDLDGTLLDTAPDLGAALNFVLERHGFPAKSYQEYRVESSNGALGLLKMGMGEKFEKYDAEVLRAALLQYYQANICRNTRPFEGIVDLINHLDKNRIPWGIITNKPGFLTEPLLTHIPEFKHCRVCYSGDTFEQRKPHPEPLLKAAEKLSIEAENIWYVGDAKRDMEAARAAHMVPVLARYGYLTEAELQQNWDVDITVDSAREIMLLLNENAFG
ncbi:HAD family hydrolase [Planctobacterium marinum]|uniref:Phosphoglycolate phosphatase n=1 Tax=Planctobacterium marinum TaxID=1631968 RepID=A0AA48HHT2_9ALTE|nr:phosphoglycolate phosphatase [Planctobacterium marinum]